MTNSRRREFVQLLAVSGGAFAVAGCVDADRTSERCTLSRIGRLRTDATRRYFVRCHRNTVVLRQAVTRRVLPVDECLRRWESSLDPCTNSSADATGDNSRLRRQLRRLPPITDSSTYGSSCGPCGVGRPSVQSPSSWCGWCSWSDGRPTSTPPTAPVSPAGAPGRPSRSGRPTSSR